MGERDPSFLPSSQVQSGYQNALWGETGRNARGSAINAENCEAATCPLDQPSPLNDACVTVR